MAVRFAPGFRDRVLARSALGPAEIERYNANYVGGDINGGAANLSQLFTRPVARISPYTTPLPGVFLCSSSTPPGGGVQGCAANTRREPRCASYAPRRQPTPRAHWGQSRLHTRSGSNPHSHRSSSAHVL